MSTGYVDDAARSDAAPIRIVISYRRDDTAGHAGRLHADLAERFGEDHVFLDIDNIKPGSDFTQALSRAVETCDVLIALIGRDWLSARGRTGQRKIDSPDDFVRIELEAALAHDVKVIPVLVRDAEMPSSEELPDSLSRLARIQALEILDRRWRSDFTELVTLLEDTAEEKRQRQAQARHEEVQAQAHQKEQARLEEQARQAEARQAERARQAEQARLEQARRHEEHARQEDQARLEEQGRQEQLRREQVHRELDRQRELREDRLAGETLPREQRGQEHRRPTERTGFEARSARGAAVLPLVAAGLLVSSLSPYLWETGGGQVRLSSEPWQTAGIVAFSVLLVVASGFLLKGRHGAQVGIGLLLGLSVPALARLIMLVGERFGTGPRELHSVGPGYYLYLSGLGAVVLGGAVGALAGRDRLALGRLLRRAAAPSMLAAGALAAVLAVSWGAIDSVGAGFAGIVLAAVALAPMLLVLPSSVLDAGPDTRPVRTTLTAIAVLYAVALSVFIAASLPSLPDYSVTERIESAAEVAYALGTGTVLVLALRLLPVRAGTAASLGLVLGSVAVALLALSDPARNSAGRAALGLGLAVAVLATFIVSGARTGART